MPQQNERKVGWTAVRVPLFIVVALLAMLAIGVLIYNRA